MAIAEYSMVAFAVLNGARTAAYFPQMLRIYRDPDRAAAVSILTWSLFAAANVATVFYALAVLHDRLMAAIFALNALGCCAITGLVIAKRMNASRNIRVLHHLVALRHSQALLDQERGDTASWANSPRYKYTVSMIWHGLLS